MTEKVEQALYFPARMLQHIDEEARRIDRSYSWCVQRAWRLAAQELQAHAADVTPAQASAVYEKRFRDEAHRRQTLFFPEAMLQEIASEAARRECSASRVVQLAWCLAADEIAAIPAAEE